MNKISDFFSIDYGQHKFNSKNGLKKGKVPLISSKGTDNGCYGFYDIKAFYKPPIITVPRTGTIGMAFVQMMPCCVDDNCLVLIPKENIPIEKLFQVCLFIRKERWRFMYGRQITPDRAGELSIILSNTQINYEMTEKSLMPSPKEHKEMEAIHYRKYRLSTFFKAVKGDGKYLEQTKVGKTPLISTKTDNNGVVGYVDLKPLFKAPAITISRISGTSLVQPFDFATVPDDVYVLKSNEDYDLKILIYFANIISYEGWRFNYGRKATAERLENLEIYIPIDSNKKINFGYMRKVVDASYGSDKLAI
jgi:hypothetical protein